MSSPTPVARHSATERSIKPYAWCGASRRRRQTGAGLLLAVAGCFALWQGLTRSSAPRSQTATVPAAPPARLVQVQSAPLSPSQLVVTGSSTVDSFSSTPGSFILVESGPRGRTVQDVDDTQLLSQLAGHRVALVRFPDRRPELILLDPAELADLPAP